MTAIPLQHICTLHIDHQELRFNSKNIFFSFFSFLSKTFDVLSSLGTLINGCRNECT